MNFIEQSIRTKSDKFYGEFVDYDEFMVALGVAIKALEELDRIKKTLFYGRNKPTDLKPFQSCSVINKDWRDKKNTGLEVSESAATDVIHTVLGMATEAGELLELLANTIRSGNFDPINFKEEMFDSMWYQAIGCNAIGITFEHGQENIIAKLRARFPEKFTETDANNRDLFTERKVLEG